MCFTDTRWRILSPQRPLVVQMFVLLLLMVLFCLIPFDNRSLVGALQYLTFTQPDLALSVHQLCQFVHHPTTSHLEAAKRVLLYMRGTLHFGIHLTLGPHTFSVFFDAD